MDASTFMLCLFLYHSAFPALRLFSSSSTCVTSSTQPSTSLWSGHVSLFLCLLEEWQNRWTNAISITPDSNWLFLFNSMFKIDVFVYISSSPLTNFLKCAIAKENTEWKQKFELNEWEQSWLDAHLALGSAHTDWFNCS